MPPLRWQDCCLPSGECFPIRTEEENSGRVDDCLQGPPRRTHVFTQTCLGVLGDLSVIDHPFLPSPLPSHLGVRCHEARHGTGCGWDTRSDAAYTTSPLLWIRIRSTYVRSQRQRENQAIDSTEPLFLSFEYVQRCSPQCALYFYENWNFT